jgi:TRAP-type C4-dicarboxylate transport system permease large subunit
METKHPMRWLLSALLIVIAMVGLGPAQAQDCTVSEFYDEALDEHAYTILGLNMRLSMGDVTLTNANMLAVNYKMLISMRAYHADARATLPSCAQAVNTAAIDAISAAQDAITMLILNQLEPDGGYDDDLRQAVIAYRDAFGVLNRAQADARLSYD